MNFTGVKPGYGTFAPHSPALAPWSLTYLGRDSQPSQTTPLWDRAVERYRDELDEKGDYQDIVEDGSFQGLLTHAESIKTLIPTGRESLLSFNRLGAVLRFVDDFSAVVALAVGADATLTAVIWGSIRLILTLAVSAGETLNDVVDMLEELSLTLPRFRDYERNLPLDKSFEIALLNVYTEAICFYARTIHFFRSHPHDVPRRRAWAELRLDFDRTIRLMKRLTAIVESEADQARMRAEKHKYGEVLDLMKNMKDARIEDKPATKYFAVPQEPGHRFWGREDALKSITDALETPLTMNEPKSFALYGMGGVGKTKIALRYAIESRQRYHAVFWISADNTISMGQSFRDVAIMLGLSSTEEEEQDSAAAILKVRKWLDESSKFTHDKLQSISSENRFTNVSDKFDSVR